MNNETPAPAMINPPAPRMLPLEPAGTVALRMPRRELAAVLRALAPIASDDPFRHLLHGVFFVHEKGAVQFVATDGRRLHLFTERAPGFYSEGCNGFFSSDLIKRAFKSVLSPKLCKAKGFDSIEIRKANPNPSRLAMDGGAVWIVSGEGLETGTIPNGNFPDFERVIPPDAFNPSPRQNWHAVKMSDAAGALVKFDETLTAAGAEAIRLGAEQLAGEGCPASDPRFPALMEQITKETKGEARKRKEIREPLFLIHSIHETGRPFSFLDLPFSAAERSPGDIGSLARIVRKGERMQTGPNGEKLIAVSKVYLEETVGAFDVLAVIHAATETALDVAQVQINGDYPGPLCIRWSFGKFRQLSALIMPQKIA